MSHPILRLYEEPGGRDAILTPAEKLTPRAIPQIVEDLEEIVAKGAQWVLLGAHDPAYHPQLEDIAWEVQERGLRAQATTLGAGLNAPGVLEPLRNAGLAQIRLVFFSTQAALHDAFVGREGAFEEALALMESSAKLNSLMVLVRVIPLKADPELNPVFLDKLQQFANRVELTRLSHLIRDRETLVTHGLSRKRANGIVQQMWEACRVTHIPLKIGSFSSYPPAPRPTKGTLQPADAALLEMLHHGVPVPSTLRGTWATPKDGDISGIYFGTELTGSLTNFGLQLAALGAPALDLPLTMGGLGLDTPPDTPDGLPLKRIDGVPRLLSRNLDEANATALPTATGLKAHQKIAIICAEGDSALMSASTLPGLAGSLTEAGHDVRVFDLLSEQAEGDLTLDESLAPRHRAAVKRNWRAWAQTLPLDPFDAFIVIGFGLATALLDHQSDPLDRPTWIWDLPNHSGVAMFARAHIKGQGRAGETPWWPGEHLRVLSHTPRLALAYHRAGVPFRQVQFIPSPLSLQQFPESSEPSEGPVLLLSDGTEAAGDVAAQLAAGGRHVLAIPLSTPIAELFRRMQKAPFGLITPAAALTVARDPSFLSLALAAKCPMICPASPTTVDHLRHGHNAMLIPPRSERALVKGYERLQDTGLLQRLTQGAHGARPHLDIGALASHLHHGFPSTRVYTPDQMATGPFYSWPLTSARS